MNAMLLLRERRQIAPDAFVDVKIWRVPVPVRGSAHLFKYSLALIAAGDCVLRFDNEAGKGDHRHIGADERPYAFSTTEALVEDFLKEVRAWQSGLAGA